MAVLTTIYMARKPLEGTVASNALKHGTGSLNIDGTRLGNTTELHSSRPRADRTTFIKGFVKGTETVKKAHGRWPANVIIQHQPGCKLVGTHVEDFTINVYSDATKGNFSSYTDEDDERPDYEAESSGQVVDEWECVEGCPCADIEQQAGGSRYFKQVRAEENMSIPSELVEYLCNMMGAPGLPGIYWAELTDERLAATPDDSLTGLLTVGEPTPDQAVEIMRVLMPGAHLMLAAPEERPTGHVGACRVEDAGFEIRDCILWVREPGRFHYVAKAARREREAGCGHLKGKAGHEAVDRKEGSAGVTNPRAGAGRTAKHIKNHHPTVKPISIMERLLADVSSEATVLDPFMGSGTTGIACTRTGHSFVGIEREPEFLEIADARIRHWDNAVQGWIGAEIISDHEPPEDGGKKALDLDDIFA